MSDQERFPQLTDGGRARLRWLEEHAHAPRYNHRGVDRLTAEGLLRVRAFEDELNTARRGWASGATPVWLEDFTQRAWRTVPYYRAYGARPDSFFDIPLTDRADLSREPWSFVPDSAPLDGLIVYQTSGTTGHPLNILSHPETAAHYLPLLRRALAIHGIALEDAEDSSAATPHVAIALVCAQASTYTYAAVSSYLNQAGFVKINLNPLDWRDPGDPVRFLDDCQPHVYTGDPLSLTALAALDLRSRPRALVSTAMALLPGLRARLKKRFGCSVVDVYSLNEAGPVAVADSQGDGHLLLSHRLFVEVLNDGGEACVPGERGEVVLSGGFNPYLPLLRYRTGDYARLDLSDLRRPRLLDLEGRAPVIFDSRDGRPVNNIDVTAVLKPLALPQFTLHQAAGGALTLRVPPEHLGDAAPRAALLSLFGADQPLAVEPLEPTPSGKVVQYTQEVAPA